MRRGLAQAGSLTDGIEAALAALSDEPGLAGALGAESAVLVWSRDAGRILWASGPAAELRASLADASGAVHRAFPARARLAALAGGLAPRAGMRVERLRLEPGGLGAPSTLACRILPLGDEDCLVTVFLGRPPKLLSRPASADLAAESREGGLPPFVERLRRQGTRRFIWSIDRDGRFSSVSAPLAEVVGAGSAALVGRSWDEIAADIVIDADGAVARHLDRRATWSDHQVLWRVADTSFVVPVELGGMPVFASGREFDGFRGFGLCRASDARPGPTSPSRLVTPADEGLPASAGPDGAADGPPEGVLPAAVAGWSGSSFAPFHARLTGQLGAARRLPIRPAERGGTERENRPSLSVTERGALREIAEALGARLEEDEPLIDPNAASAEVVQLPIGHARDSSLPRFLDRLPAGIVVMRGGAPVFANRFLLDLLGYPDLRAMVRRGGTGGLFASGTGDRAGPGDGSRPVTLLAASGATVPLDMRLTTVEWGEGPASLLLVRPLPGREEASAAPALELDLARRDLRLRELTAALDAAELGVVVVDPLARITSLTAAAERMFGYSQNEVAGDSFTILLAPESHAEALELVTSVERVQPPVDPRAARLTGRTRDGTFIRLGASVGAVGGPERAGVVLTFRDVSGDVGAQAELNAARRAADAALARQTEFLARVSHEIRTPLNAIIGFAEIMLEERFGPVGSDRYRSYLRDVHVSGQHVVSLVGDLLDLAKVTSGKAELTFTAQDLNDVLERAVGLLQPLAASERVILRTGLAPDLPRIVADERSLRQIALNLVSNAIRFTPAGGQVIVSSRLSDGGGAAFRVRDTGIGMSPAEMEAALEPFRQVSSTRREDGTGLGLPLSKALAEANHGTLSLSSPSGGGVLAEVMFPASRVLSD